jgi:hypothetical protein
MSALARLFAGAWGKAAAIAAGLAALGAALVFVARRLVRAGGDAARADAAEAAHEHQTRTASQVRDSDEALADPASRRARRVRRLFERDD